MKKVKMTGEFRRMAWEGLLANPDGYKTEDKRRSVYKLLDVLEEDFADEVQKPTEEQLKQEYELFFDDGHFELLKQILKNNIPWFGLAIKRVRKLEEALDKAENWQPPKGDEKSAS